MILWISLLVGYFLIGGLIHGIVTDKDDELNYTAAFIWPALVVISIGEWVGIKIKTKFKL